MYPILLGMHVLTTADLQTLEIYCTLYARWRKAESKLDATDGAWLVKTPNEHVQASPWIAIANRAAELCKGYLTELGLTVASRARLGVEEGRRPPGSSGASGSHRPGGKFGHLMGRE